MPSHHPGTLPSCKKANSCEDSVFGRRSNLERPVRVMASASLQFRLYSFLGYNWVSDIESWRIQTGKGERTLPKMEINISKEVRAVLVESLKRYYWNEKNEELSSLGAELLLDFIMNDIGPYIYNKAIEDSYAYMNERIEDLLGLEKRLR
ncbi:MAG: DUF2164 domain-containing protein [Desulfosporosinus sp.]|nr:DUF2164 domain-containing protein [Desulfosporosinus sp.]